MRDPERLDTLYAELHKLHKTYVPDWRFGQFIMNFYSWWATKTRMTDPWFMEDSEMINYIREYTKEFE